MTARQTGRAPMSELLMWPGMSSSPSYVCVKNSRFHRSGTTVLSVLSRSPANPAGPPSHSASDADVCFVVRQTSPDPPGTGGRRVLLTTESTTWQPRLGARKTVLALMRPAASAAAFLARFLRPPLPPPVEATGQRLSAAARAWAAGTALRSQACTESALFVTETAV